MSGFCDFLIKIIDSILIFVNDIIFGRYRGMWIFLFFIVVCWV